MLLSLSTTLQGQAEALPGLLGALASLPIRVLLTLGGVLTPGTVPAPANVTTRGYISHEAVLPHIAAVITHGGMSTVATSLAAGVPMVCVPQGRDQPLNAARVQELGAGLTVRHPTRRRTSWPQQYGPSSPGAGLLPPRSGSPPAQPPSERRTRHRSGPSPGNRRRHHPADRVVPVSEDLRLTGSACR